VAPSGNGVALEPAVALLFELVEAPGEAALGELVPMSLQAPSATAAASAIVAIAIFSRCIGINHSCLSPAPPDQTRGARACSRIHAAPQQIWASVRTGRRRAAFL